LDILWTACEHLILFHEYSTWMLGEHANVYAQIGSPNVPPEHYGKHSENVRRTFKCKFEHSSAYLGNILILFVNVLWLSSEYCLGVLFVNLFSPSLTWRVKLGSCSIFFIKAASFQSPAQHKKIFPAVKQSRQDNNHMYKIYFDHITSITNILIWKMQLV
jgi:hypothetical protein